MTKKVEKCQEETNEPNIDPIRFGDSYLSMAKSVKPKRPFTKAIGWLGATIVAANIALCAALSAQGHRRADEIRAQVDRIVVQVGNEYLSAIEETRSYFGGLIRARPSMDYETLQILSERWRLRDALESGMFEKKLMAAQDILQEIPLVDLRDRLFIFWCVVFTAGILGRLVVMGDDQRRYVSGLSGSAYRFLIDNRIRLKNLRARCDAHDERMRSFRVGSSAFRSDELREAYQEGLKQLEGERSVLIEEADSFLAALYDARETDRRRLVFIDDCSSLAEIRNALKGDHTSTESRHLRADGAQALLEARLMEQAGEIGMPQRFLELAHPLPTRYTSTSA